MQKRSFLTVVMFLIGMFMTGAYAQVHTVSGLVKDKEPEFGISDCRFSCYARFPIGAYYICPPNNMDGKMQEL